MPLRASPPASRLVTPEAIRDFGIQTGDHSAIHFDPEAARASGFPDTIAHGLLTASWAFAAALEAGDRERLPGIDPVEMEFRLSRVVGARDRLQFETGAISGTGRTCPLAVKNDRGEFVLRGTLRFAEQASPFVDETPAADLPRERRENPGPEPRDQEPMIGSPFYAEDLVEAGPDGCVACEASGWERTQRFAESISERAREATRRDVTAVAPMFEFCLGFSVFLEALLALPMPSTGSAGHVGDHWQLHAPLDPTEPLTTRFRTLSARPTRSRPDLSLVRFGIQRVRADEKVVLSGETLMMIANRSSQTR